VRLLLVGPPGAGKGTQAAKLAERLDVPHISTGDLFRANLEEETPLGVEAKRYMDAGDLVPDQVTVEMVRERLTHDDAVKGYLLDGFPRTLPQALRAQEIGQQEDLGADAVVYLTAPEPVLVSRLLARAAEQGRADDTPEVVSHRLAVYAEATAPLIDHYRERGLLMEVDADRPVAAIRDDLRARLDERGLLRTGPAAR
jgi:adenylate kinase